MPSTSTSTFTVIEIHAGDTASSPVARRITVARTADGRPVTADEDPTLVTTRAELAARYGTALAGERTATGITGTGRAWTATSWTGTPLGCR